MTYVHENTKNVKFQGGSADEWGPEIKVDGKRPEWLGDDAGHLGYMRNNGTWYGPNKDWWSENDILNNNGWSTVSTIRLPANHPHYAPETHRQGPNGILTGAERLERLEALTARLAAIEVRSFHGDDLAGLVHEARGLVVDPDLVKAREIMAEVYTEAGRSDLAEAALSGKMDGRLRLQATIRGIKAGREMEA